VAEIVEEISSSEYAIDDRLSRLRWMPEFLDGIPCCSMELFPLPYQQAIVGHVLDHRMLEHVGRLGQ